MSNKQTLHVFTLEQEERFTELQTTTMSGEVASERKTDQELMHQIINAGLTAVEQQRKQYQKGKLLKKLGQAMEDERFQRDNKDAFDALQKFIMKKEKN